MSKHQKLLQRICSSPTPSDVRWSELKAVMESLGYEMTNGKGSRRRLYNKATDALILCHEPHGSNVDKACVADFADHLRSHGLIKGAVMGTLKYKDYEGTVEYDEDRAMLRGKVLFTSDLILYEGKDVSSLQKDFEEGVDDYLSACAEFGKEPQKPCTGQFSVRVPPELHRKATEKAARDGEKLNTVIVRALDVYLNGSSTNFHVHLAENKIVATAMLGQTERWESRRVH